MWNVDIARISNGHISILLEAAVTWSGMLVVLYVLHMRYDLTWYKIKVKVKVTDCEFLQIALFYVYLLRHFGMELKTDGWLQQYGI